MYRASRLLRKKVSGFLFCEVPLDRPVLVRCASCGRNFETDRYGKQTCPICGAEIALESPEGEPVPVPDPDPEDVPVPVPETVPEIPQVKLEILPAWEVPGKSLILRFFATLRQVLSAPSLLFYGLKIGNFGRALSFGWILCTLAVFFSVLYSLWSLDRDPQAILRNLQIPAGTNPQEIIDALRGRLMTGLYTSPLLGLLNLFVSALLYHLGVWLLAKKNRGFLATFRATAYACAPLILAVIPFIGLLIGGLGTIALQVLALSAVHRIPPLRAGVAVILPTLALLLLLAAFF
jgi:hypothetical protein